MTTTLDQALAYAARGWRVIPIAPGEKFPKGFEAWQNDATTDEQTIRAWWAQHPRHGVGIVTGPASNLWVLDIDVADGKAGDETLADLEDGYGALPGTYEVITGSGGRHLYFTWPDDMEVRNKQSGLLGSGIDVRGEGGFVVAPPTIHPNGKPYETEAMSAPDPAPAPDWLLALLREPERQPRIAQPPSPDAGTRPGDIWAAAVTWDEILTRDGWTHHHTAHNGEDYWTRPGKERREGASATVGYQGNDMLWVGTTSMAHAGLQSFTSYDKLGYLAATRFDGQIPAAAAWCRSQGHHSHSTRTALAGGIHEPPPEPWEKDPTPLDEPEGFPEVPVDAFPDWIAAQIRNVTNQLLCDPCLPATFALGALSVASLGHFQIKVRAGQTMRTTGLFLVSAGPPSSGKSTALDMMMDPVKDYEAESIAAAAQVVAQAAAAKAIAAKRAKEAVDNAARMAGNEDGPARKAEAERLAAEAETIEIPPSGELITGDITPERLATIMAENGERFAVVADEAGVLNIDRYGDKASSTKMDLYLQGFTGQSVAVHRQNAPTVRLRHPLLAIVIGVQPGPLDAAFASKEFRSRGFVQRFLITRTAKEANNTDLERDVWDHAADQRYRERIGQLARQWGSWQHHATLDLEPATRRQLSDWARDLKARGAVGEELDGESEWVSKMRDSTIRIAALLHLGDGGRYDEPVAPGTAERAITIAEWFIAHYVRQAEDTAEQARKLLAALLKIATKREEAERDPSRYGPKMPRTAKQALSKWGPVGLRTIPEYWPALEQLAQHGWVRLTGVTGPPGQAFDQQIRNCEDIELHPRARAARDGAVSRGGAVAGEPQYMLHTEPETESNGDTTNGTSYRATAPNASKPILKTPLSVKTAVDDETAPDQRGNAVSDPLAGTPWAVGS